MKHSFRACQFLVQERHPVYITRCFSTCDNHRWELISVVGEPATACSPAVFNIFLKAQDVSKEVFLYQTLKKDKNQTVWKILRPGTLVEVDYGFAQQTGRPDASTKTNKRYSDMLLWGEMHKRRLAVVVKVVSANLVQVAPVTSVAPSQGDKSVFKIDQATLNRMPRYKFSGHSSYVLCGRTEAVSIQRLLPPMSFGTGSPSRNVRYTVALAKAEEKLLKAALIHAIGASNYVPYNLFLQEKLRADKLQHDVERLARELLVSLNTFQKLKTVENLAKRWASEWELDYDAGLACQRGLDGASAE
ncbi:hypothetical protein [Pseudomonas cannabina]|uniref:Uncharacterized protein n=1 Tax=Pseudomonas cannabina TaxID=86840 RepID=A0A0N8QWX4_PSECA|nr:hypothetical protein [Pseudomonas cannabina]KAA8707398.1 hypothetical protein F4W70_19215 [Pseudomonas cannabina]KPW71198.1 Uncharacterized protein ALO81_01523 [Pseudomonas cannabina]SDR39360.1 hypothetical protein SAMN05216597_4254 [Pseudomonas cannabina]